MTRLFTSSFVAALALAGASSVALAAGGGGGDSGGSWVQTCPNGQVWDSEQNTCVNQQSNIIPDQDLTNQAFALADEGRFDTARDLIDLRAGGHDAMSLTALGYITRKEGDPAASINYYMQAIAMDARDTRVRQYLGEAYVQLGWIDDARRQLQMIADIAGSDSLDYVSLAEVIEAVS